MTFYGEKPSDASGNDSSDVDNLGATRSFLFANDGTEGEGEHKHKVVHKRVVIHKHKAAGAAAAPDESTMSTGGTAAAPKKHVNRKSGNESVFFTSEIQATLSTHTGCVPKTNADIHAPGMFK